MRPQPPQKRLPEAISDVDSQIVNARTRWLNAAWEENVEQAEQARRVIDLLLERRLEIMHGAAGEPAA